MKYSIVLLPLFLGASPALAETVTPYADHTNMPAYDASELRATSTNTSTTTLPNGASASDQIGAPLGAPTNSDTSSPTAKPLPTSF